MWSIFQAHPASVGETYLQHFASAMRFSFTLLAAGIVCAIHAALPFLFTQTGSRLISALHAAMVEHRHRSATALRDREARAAPPSPLVPLESPRSD